MSEYIFVILICMIVIVAGAFVIPVTTITGDR